MQYIGSLKFDDILTSSQEIIICGCGKMLGYIVDELTDLNLIQKVVAICDNDKTKWGSYYNNIMVCSYQNAIEKYSNAEIIVYNQYAKEIAEQISEYVDKIHYIFV